MPTIKNVGTHLDVLDDGRPLPAEAVATITAKQFELAHYQTRIADGVLIEVPKGSGTRDHTPTPSEKETA